MRFEAPPVLRAFGERTDPFGRSVVAGLVDLQAL